jgi:DNA repair exonuclease SbcCD ATPase subunit
MNQIEKLDKKITEVKGELRELGSKIGMMNHTPRYDQSYSSAKLDNWSRDQAKLQEKLDGLQSELAAVKADPKFVADKEAHRIEIRRRLEVLRAEYDQAAKDFNRWRAESVAGIAEASGDPLKLAIASREKKEKLDLLSAAILLAQDALKVLIAK